MGTGSGRKGFIRRESCELVRIYRSEIRKTALGSRGGNERVGTNERACSARAVAFYAPRLKILKTDCVTHVLSDCWTEEGRKGRIQRRAWTELSPNRTMSALCACTHACTHARNIESNDRIDDDDEDDDDDETEARAAELSVAVEGLATGGQSNGQRGPP